MFSDLSNQVARLTRVCRSSRALDKVSATVRTNEIHLSRAVGAKSALVAANAGFAIGDQNAPAFFALFFHFQRHRFRRV